ncbi:glucose-1-phosphate adenylyltransferase large subunit 1 [Pyrus ussuriensis x Pyrus communis]|uniref:Glucose-1-phosphate adenylyltransferase large subunit 1 n=1 Tax=Pyrus ussuriensis x Pyrus communis TaxID=2448454 RepID=A0A5N5GC11_9ROSA|nr:glucose-1-phosphate adenylyltransferase large subunit 1 [Pyrus ussuriensis x Pyrus communis]
MVAWRPDRCSKLLGFWRAGEEEVRRQKAKGRGKKTGSNSNICLAMLCLPHFFMTDDIRYPPKEGEERRGEIIASNLTPIILFFGHPPPIPFLLQQSRLVILCRKQHRFLRTTCRDGRRRFRKSRPAIV